MENIMKNESESDYEDRDYEEHVYDSDSNDVSDNVSDNVSDSNDEYISVSDSNDVSDHVSVSDDVIDNVSVSDSVSKSVVDKCLQTDPSYVQLIQLTVIASDGSVSGGVSVDKSDYKQEFYIYNYKTDNVYTVSVLNEPTETFQTIIDFILNETPEFIELKEKVEFVLDWVDGENPKESTAEFLARPLYSVPLAQGLLLCGPTYF